MGKGKVWLFLRGRENGLKPFRICYIIKKIQFHLFEGKCIKNLDAICVQGQFGAIL
jgi:hypothetical protein